MRRSRSRRYVDARLLAADGIGDWTSRLFSIEGIVQVDTVRLTYYSVLARSPNGGPVTVLVRSQGTD